MTPTIEGKGSIGEAYRDRSVADSYIGARFQHPLGALLHSRQQRELLRLIRREEPGQVLEIAPGPARLTVGVARVLDRGTIVDFSWQMLTVARNRLRAVDGAGWSLVQGDAFSLPFGASFDLIFTFRFIRHFEESERRKLYGQIASVLRPGGLLVFDAVNERVSAPLRARAGPGSYTHYDALLRPESLRQELAATGFAEVSLIGVQHRYPLLRRLQIVVAPRSRWLARAAMELVDRSGGEPLEWVVVCRRS